MSRRFAYLFPGQGAQYVGMGKDFYDQFPIARQTFEEADDLLGQTFSKLIFEGPGEELTLTKNSQLAIYIVSIAIWRTFQQQCPDVHPTLCAGLSLGEYTALTAAGKVSFADCLQLVKARGLYMHEACLSSPGTMRVVLGLEVEAVEKALAELGSDSKVWIANLNCPGQVVIAGDLAHMDKAAEHLKVRGAKRVLPLDVSGAFHSPLMREAQERLSPIIQATPLKETPVSLIMNSVGRVVSSLDEIRKSMTDQVTHPVFWEKGIRSVEGSVDLYIEMGCGKTLSGMNKKIGTLAPTLTLEKVTDLDTVITSLMAGV
ncbi:MAG: ACP S-malonyltransferase [Chlamydiales bacterium]|nr:ACP S-malonyltransferase [Chlamydiales bacterium]